MFGYLKMDGQSSKDLNQEYKKYYCFLCRSLQKHYGVLARFFLSYDVAFFLILCADDGFLNSLEKVHCIKNSENLGELLDSKISKDIATLNLQLMAAKLEDDIIDDNDATAKIAKLIFSGKINRAKKAYPKMWEILTQEYDALRMIENRAGKLDELEIQFSKMMVRIATECFGVSDVAKIDALELGTRWIYFIDAVDDIDKNISEGVFNPLSQYGSFENLKNNHYIFLAEHFSNLYRNHPYVDGNKSAEIINRLINYRLLESTVNVLTKERCL
jgi:hypothetical protein